MTLVAGSNITITPSGSNITIASTGGGTTYTFADSLVNTSGTVTLVNDSATPGNSKYYGTNSGGTLGYFSLPSPGTGTVTSVSVVSANGFAGTVATATTTPAITLSTTVTGLLTGNGTAISAYTGGNLTDVGTDGIVITGGTGAVIGAGTSIAQAAASASQNGYLSSANFSTFNGKLTSTLASGDIFVGNGSNVATAVAMSGDATLANTGAITFATVNTNTGSFGSTSAIPNFTVNGKGLITAAGTSVVVAPAGTLTGTTLASNVVTSSLTSVGTIATGIWNGTTIAVANGGTSLGTLTLNNVILGNGTSAPNFVAPSTSGNVLTSNGTTWVSSAAGTSAAPVAASYHCSTNQATTSNTQINFDTSDFDTNSAVTTGASWEFTAPTTGYYQVSVNIIVTSGVATLNYQLYKNGSLFNGQLAQSGLEANQYGSGAYTISLTAGDTIDVRPSATVTVVGGALAGVTTTSWINIQQIQGAINGAITSLGNFGSTANAQGASLSSGILTLQPASGTQPGGVSTGTQTLAGAKTFSSNVTLSGTSNAVGTITSGVWNGTVTAGQSFLTSGTTYTTPSNTTTATQWKFTLVGGGGGGPGVPNTTNFAGSAGGAGAVGVHFATGIAGNTALTYAIGAAGSAGSAGTNNGGTGGNTTITIGGTTYTAGGGSPGISAVSMAGGAGGTLTNFAAGDIQIVGQAGASSAGVGSGGPTMPGGSSGLGYGFGGLTLVPGANNPGVAGTGFGAGGTSGRAANTSPSAEAGGAGTAGCILAEYWN